MLLATLPAAAALPPFTCDVIRVHDGDGPLWCRSGQKVRIAGVQAPDFENAQPCRRPAALRAAYTCDDEAAERSRTIVERLVLHRRLSCQPVGRSYSRIVAGCTLPDGRSVSCAAIAAKQAVAPGDVAVFARETFDDERSRYSFPDIKEEEPGS